MKHSPIKVISPLMIKSSSPILKSPKKEDWYLSKRKDSIGESTQMYGTKASFTFRLVKIPKANNPNSGP